MKKIVSFVLVLTLLATAAVIPFSVSASASEVYYDSDVVGTWWDAGPSDSGTHPLGYNSSHRTYAGFPTQSADESDEDFAVRYANAEKTITFTPTNTANYGKGYFYKYRLNADADYSYGRHFKVTLKFKRTGSRDEEVQIWPTLMVASGKYLKEGNFTPSALTIADGYTDFISSLADDDEVLYFNKGVYRSQYFSGKLLYPICILGKTTDDTFHEIEYIYYIKNNTDKSVRVRSIMVDGIVHEVMPTTAARNALTQDDNTILQTYCSGSYQAQNICQLVYAESGALEWFCIPPKPAEGEAAGLCLSKIKYEGMVDPYPLEPENVLADGEVIQTDACTVANNGMLSLQFAGQHPEATVVLESAGSPVSCESYWEGKSLCLDFSRTQLIVGQSYQVTVNSIGQSYDLPFTAVQAKNKLRAAAEDSLHEGAVTVNVRNLTDSDCSFTTLLALYQKQEDGVIMLHSEEKNQTLSAMEEKALNVGELALPADQSECWYKVFLLENGQSIGKAVVVGNAATVPVSAQSAEAGLHAQSPIVTEESAHVALPCTYAGSSERPRIFGIFYAPDDTVVYCDELTANESGSSFTFAFFLPLPASSGSYTYQLTSSLGETESGQIEVNFGNVAPSCSKPSIEGTPVPGEALSAQYQYSHIAGVAEGNSQIRWLSSATQDADSFQTVIGEGGELMLEAKHLRSYVLAEVTPVNSDGISGETKRSDPIFITAMPQISNLRITQSGNILTAAYEYTHAMGFEEQGSQFSWFLSSEPNGAFSPVGENRASYSLTKEDNNKYFKVLVTPVSSASSELTLEHCGKPTESAVYCASFIGESGSSTTQGGGGGRGNGSSSGIGGGTITVPTTPETQQPGVDGTLDFTDVRGHWAEKEIYALYDKNIIKGRTEHTFEPDSSITRAEFAALLIRVLQLSPENAQGIFTDVSENDWYYADLQAAAQYGIVTGDGGFAHPQQKITRSEMAAMAVRAYELVHDPIILSGDLLDFDDAALIAEWATGAICKAKEAKLVTGSDGLFRPLDTALRAEAAVIIERVMKNMNLESITRPVNSPQLNNKTVEEQTENVTKEQENWTRKGNGGGFA